MLLHGESGYSLWCVNYIITICFQTYIDLYNLEKDVRKIARAREVMEYQMSTPRSDYWWWADGLYMVMPVLTKLYKVTGNKSYLRKLHEYFGHANGIMYDGEEGLYFRDAKYVYPKHRSANGKKDFWARGNGWVFAGLAKVLKDLPENDPRRGEYVGKFKGLARALKKSQQPEGYWTRSLLDPAHAPGPETSGTAFFTYGMLWGINNGHLDEKEYLPVVVKSWEYLTKAALQPDGKVGYVQPVGERAIPGQVVDRNSTANFGVGAFLLTASEMYRYLDSTPPPRPSPRPGAPRLVPVGKGWARNQVNAIIFRRNAVVSHGRWQYVAYYDADARVVLAKRKLGGSEWEVRRTRYAGDARDAHKSISIAVDGEGYLHVVWNQHDSPLQYCRGLRPGSLELSAEMPMLAEKERRVTYPEFYNLPGGGLLFLYRDGASGGGNLVLNRYDPKTKRWERLQDRLVDGEGERNAYWQATVDVRGHIHLSWVWRETPDVATNHDLCYAKSVDGGRTWLKSTGEPYRLPVTAATAEYVLRIPQQSGLINQTSMSADSGGRPYIATYWRPGGTEVPQYHLVYSDGSRWRTVQVTRRTTPFSLGGRGTRRIPVSRPQLAVGARGGRPVVLMIFRDGERGERVSVAVCGNLPGGACPVSDLTEDPVGMWEPSYDPVVWQRKGELHLFVQRVGQGEAEVTEDIPAQAVSILEWRPGR